MMVIKSLDGLLLAVGDGHWARTSRWFLPGWRPVPPSRQGRELTGDPAVVGEV